MFGKTDKNELDVLVLKREVADLKQEIKETDSFIGDREKLERYVLFERCKKKVTLSELKEDVNTLERKLNSLCSLVADIVESTGDSNVVAAGGSIFRVYTNGVERLDGIVFGDGSLSKTELKRSELKGLVDLYPVLAEAMDEQKKEEE